MFIKICGITRLEDAELACELGASALGFVFWPSSPRFIDPHRARAIVRSLPPGVAAVGVFVNQPLEHVRAVAALVRLGAVQLHGDEPLSYVEEIKDRVIRAVSLHRPSSERDVDRLPSSVTVLVDAHDPERRGGTGRIVDWEAAARIARRRRTILSGGLRAENVGEAIDRVQPYGIDVSSGVEEHPGVKDRALLGAFFEAARTARINS